MLIVIYPSYVYCEKYFTTANKMVSWDKKILVSYSPNYNTPILLFTIKLSFMFL